MCQASVKAELIELSRGALVLSEGHLSFQCEGAGSLIELSLCLSPSAKPDSQFQDNQSLDS